MSFKSSGVPQGIAMPSRRRFVQGLAAGGAIAGLGLWPRASWAQTAQAMPTLRGTEFDLSIGETLVNYTGSTRPAVTINGTVPGPLLRIGHAVAERQSQEAIDLFEVRRRLGGAGEEIDSSGFH